MPTGKRATAKQIAKVQALLAVPKSERLSQRAIAKKAGVGRHKVSDIKLGRAPRKRGKRKGGTYYEDGTLVREMGYCAECKHDCLIPCVVCGARNYQRAHGLPVGKEEWGPE
jgi:hypothetical protein